MARILELMKALETPSARPPARGGLIVDLQAATSLDSTFMGILLMLHGQRVDIGAEGLVIINSSPQCRRQLTLVGLDRLVRMPVEPIVVPAVEGVTIDARPLSDEQLLHLIEVAHCKLVEADPRNRAKFGPLVDSLREARRP